MIDFVTDLPEDEGKDAVLTVIDKATKMVYFCPCIKSIIGKETTHSFEILWGASTESPL